jgi:hypothetical protein
MRSTQLQQLKHEKEQQLSDGDGDAETSGCGQRRRLKLTDEQLILCGRVERVTPQKGERFV